MITEMVKVEIGIPQQYKEEVMTWLQEEEILHVTEVNDRGEGRHNDGETDKQLAYIQFALEFIARVKKELNVQPKREWKNMFAGKPTALVAGLEQSLQNISIDKIDKKVRVISDELASIKVRQQELENVLAELTPWQSLAISGRELKESRNFIYGLVAIGIQEDMLVKRRLMALKTAVWQEVNRVAEKKKGRVYMEVAVDKSEKEQLDQLMVETNATLVDIAVPDDMTVRQYIQSLKNEQDAIEHRYQAGLESGRRLFKLERELMFAYDGLLHRQERAEALQRGLNLPRVTVIGGWMPEVRYKQIVSLLEKEFPGVAVEINKDTKEEPPVALRNSKWVEPFEAVTNIFGQPKPTELDPSGPLALFFLISFGLALTDAGYGLVMMAATWLAERYLRLKRPVRKMMRLLFFGGAATVIAGVFTGGWFGIQLESLPAGELRNVLLSLKLIDPVTEPMVLLLVVFALGIVQLLFAWLIRAYDHARQKNFTAMVFDDIAWVVMVVVLLMWAASIRGIWLVEWSQSLSRATLVMAGMLVLTGGRGFKNPFLKFGGGVLSLYGLVSFLSDTLSYSRLLALGLATGIIGLVVNMLGVMVGTSVPVIGWALAVIVLIVGHVFNLGINTLGAFIHSGRLQFVEFFPKFLEGGGKPYRPLGRVSKYVDNPREFV